MTKKEFIKQFQQLEKEAEELGKKDISMLGVARVMKQQLIKMGAHTSSNQNPKPKGFAQLDEPTEEEKSKVSARDKKEAKIKVDETKEEIKRSNEEKSSTLIETISKLTAANLEKDYSLSKLKVIANGLNQTNEAGIQIVDDAKELSLSIYKHFNPTV